MVSERRRGSAAYAVARKLNRRIYFALAAVFVAVAMLSTTMLAVRYDQSLQREQRRAENLAAILADHFARSVEGVDATLRALALYSSRTGAPEAGNRAWQSLIDTALAGVPGARGLLIINEQGIITHSTVAGTIGGDRTDLSLFRELADTPAEGVVADPLFVSSRDGTPLIVFGHRLVGPEGRFAGIALAALEPSRMQAFYRRVDAGPNGVVSVLHPGGRIIFQEASGAASGEATAAAILAAQRERADGGLRATVSRGGDEYLIGYRTLAEPGLVVAVSFAREDVLAGWRRHGIAQAVMLAVIAFALGWCAWFTARTMQARERTETRFRAMLDHAPLVFAVKDRHGKYTFVNKAFEHLARRQAAAVLGRRVHDFVPEVPARLTEAMDRQVFETACAVQREISGIDPADGRERTFLLIKFPLYDARGQVEAVGTVAADLTQQHAMQAQLVHAGKMEALGQLTGGIAHDFNNVLTVIRLNADVLCRQIADRQWLALAKEVSLAAERGSQLTTRLLAFARRQSLQPQPTDVDALIASMAGLMRRTLGSHVEVELVAGGALPHAAVDPAQLESALLNLAVNARDAMPGGGRLRIETGSARIEAGENGGGTRYVTIALADNGCGMTPETRARVFEPFFTTKEVGKGTGLCLPMVYGFVQQSGGRVEIESELGAGTTVTLFLPCAQESAETDPVPAGGGALPTGSEDILLVEGDPAVRACIRSQLADLGYAVRVADGAAQALAMVGAGYRPDLLLADVAMPVGVAGPALASVLRDSVTGLRVLYVCGHAPGMCPPEGCPVAEHEILRKPFEPERLAIRVRAALDGPAEGSAGSTPALRAVG